MGQSRPKKFKDKEDITRREIPSRSYKRLVELYESKSSREGSKAQPSSSVMLSEATLDDLIHEVESRGWLIDLRRRASGE